VNFGLKDDATNEPVLNDCILTFPDRDFVSVGQEVVAMLRPLHPELLEHKVHAGHAIEVCEGRTIAIGEVSRTLH
jgi:hypothetical protein